MAEYKYKTRGEPEPRKQRGKQLQPEQGTQPAVFPMDILRYPPGSSMEDEAPLASPGGYLEFDGGDYYENGDYDDDYY